MVTMSGMNNDRTADRPARLVPVVWSRVLESGTPAAFPGSRNVFLVSLIKMPTMYACAHAAAPFAPPVVHRWHRSSSVQGTAWPICTSRPLRKSCLGRRMIHGDLKKHALYSYDMKRAAAGLRPAMLATPAIVFHGSQPREEGMPRASEITIEARLSVSCGRSCWLDRVGRTIGR